MGLISFTFFTFQMERVATARMHSRYRLAGMAVSSSYIFRSLGKFLSQSARSSTIRWFRSATKFRWSGLSLVARKNRLANCSAEFAGASQPLCPSSTHSRFCLLYTSDAADE